jgi:hypothetical protein
VILSPPEEDLMNTVNPILRAVLEQRKSPLLADAARHLAMAKKVLKAPDSKVSVDFAPNPLQPFDRVLKLDEKLNPAQAQVLRAHAAHAPEAARPYLEKFIAAVQEPSGVKD